MKRAWVVVGLVLGLLYPGSGWGNGYTLTFQLQDGGPTYQERWAMVSPGAMFEQEPKRLYKWFADEAEVKGKRGLFGKGWEGCLGDSKRCPPPRSTRLILHVGGQDLTGDWPIRAETGVLVQKIFAQSVKAWEVLSAVSRSASLEKEAARLWIRSLAAYAQGQDAATQGRLAQTLLRGYGIWRTKPEMEFFYPVEKHLAGLEGDRRFSAWLGHLRRRIYSPSAHLDLWQRLSDPQGVPTFLRELRLLTFDGKPCEATKKATFGTCHDPEGIEYLRRWVLRSAYHLTFSKSEATFAKKRALVAWLGQVFDRSEEPEARGERFTVDTLLEEADEDRRTAQQLQTEGIRKPTVYRRMVFSILGRMRVTQAEQRRRAYRKMILLAKKKGLSRSVGLALRSLVSLEDAEHRQAVFEELWQETSPPPALPTSLEQAAQGEGTAKGGEEGPTTSRGSRKAWMDTLMGDPRKGWEEAYHVHPRISEENKAAWLALRQETSASEVEGWKTLFVAMSVRLDAGDDLRDPKRLSLARQQALISAAVRLFYNKGCMAKAKACEKASREERLGAKILRHLTSWRRTPLPEEEGRATASGAEGDETPGGRSSKGTRQAEVARHKFWMKPFFVTLGSTKKEILETQIDLLRRSFPRFALYQGLLEWAEVERDLLSPVVKLIAGLEEKTTEMLNDPQHFLWNRLRLFLSLAGAMGLVETCEGSRLTMALLELAKKFQEEIDKAPTLKRRYRGEAARIVRTAARMQMEKGRHCVEGKGQTDLAQVRLALSADAKGFREEISGLALHGAIGAMGRGETAKSVEELQRALHLDAIGEEYSKERQIIGLWAEVSLQKKLPCDRLKEPLETAEEMRHPAFVILRDLVWLQIQSECISRRQLFQRFLPSHDPTSLATEIQNAKEEIQAATKALLRLFQAARLSKEATDSFQGLAREAFEEDPEGSSSSRAETWAERWQGFQRLFRGALREKQASWPRQEGRLRMQGAILATTFLSNLRGYASTLAAQKEGALTQAGGAIPAIHPLLYLKEAKVDQEVEHLRRLLKTRRTQITSDLKNFFDDKARFFQEQQKARQRIYKRLQAAYLELGKMRLEAEKLGYEGEIFGLRREIAEALGSIADQEIEIAKTHEDAAKLREQRQGLEVEIRKESQAILGIQRKIQTLEKEILEAKSRGLAKEEEFLRQQEALAQETIRLTEEKKKRLAELWLVKLQETEMAVATLQMEMGAQKKAVALALALSEKVVKSAEEGLEKVTAAQAAHERRMAEAAKVEKRRSFWKNLVSVGLRIVGGVVGTLVGQPMLGVSLGGMVGDFLAKGLVDGDWKGGLRDLGVNAATVALSAGAGGALGSKASSAFGKVRDPILKGTLQRLAKTTVESLVSQIPQAIATGDIQGALKTTLQSVVSDLPAVASGALSKFAKTAKGPLGKKLRSFVRLQNKVLGSELRDLGRLGDAAFLQERALALGQEIVKKHLPKKAPRLMRHLRKLHELQTTYDLFPKAEALLKDGLSALESHMKERLEGLPQEVFSTSLAPEMKRFVEGHLPSLLKPMEAALQSRLGAQTKEILQALQGGDRDLLRTRFRDALPAVEAAFQDTLREKMQGLKALQGRMESLPREVKDEIERVEAAFRERLSLSLEGIRGFGKDRQTDVQGLLREVAPSSLLGRLRRTLTAKMPHLQAREIDAILAYQGHRYAEIATRLHTLRRQSDWKGKSEYLRFALLEREQATKLLAKQMLEGKKDLEADQKKAVLQGIEAKYRGLVQQGGRTWKDIEGAYRREMEAALPEDPTAVKLQMKILQMQVDPSMATKIVSARLRPFQDTLQEGGQKVEEACRGSFEGCKAAFVSYKTTTLAKARAFQAAIEREMEDKAAKLESLEIKKRKQELQAVVEGTQARIDIQKARQIFLGVQKDLVRLGWMREVLMFQKQQAIFGKDILAIRREQARKRVAQAKALQQEARLRTQEAAMQAGVKGIRKKIAQKRLREAEIQEKILGLRQKQHALLEARIWQRIDTLEASLRAFESDLFPSLKAGILSPGWTLQEIRRLSDRSLQRLSSDLSILFYALQQTKASIPSECRKDHTTLDIEQLPLEMTDCLQAIRRAFLASKPQISCESFTIQRGSQRSLLASEDAAAFFRALLEGGGQASFVLTPDDFPDQAKVSLVRVVFGLEIEKEDPLAEEPKSTVAVKVEMQQEIASAAASEFRLAQLQINDRSASRCEATSSFHPDQTGDQAFLYLNPFVRWRLGLRKTSDLESFQGYRPRRLRIHVYYIER